MQSPPSRVERLPNEMSKLKRFLDRIARDGEVHTCWSRVRADLELGRPLPREAPRP